MDESRGRVPRKRSRSTMEDGAAHARRVVRRTRVAWAAPPAQPRRRTLMDLSDECLLLVLACLSARDVTRMERVCQRIADLSRSSAVWRAAYHRDFVRSPSRVFPPSPAVASLATPTPHRLHDRHLAQIPARYRGGGDGMSSRASLAWKALYAVARNWTTGHTRVSALDDGSGASVAPRAKAAHEARRAVPRGGAPFETHAAHADGPVTLVQASANAIFTASRRAVQLPPLPCDPSVLAPLLPAVRVYRTDTHSEAPSARCAVACLQPHALAAALCDRARDSARLRAALQSHGLRITEMVLERGAPARALWTDRLCICLHPGVLVLLRVSVAAHSVHCDVDDVVFVDEGGGAGGEHPGGGDAPPRENAARAGAAARSSAPACARFSSPVAVARFHSGLLVTCTADFCLHIYHVRGVVGARLTLVERLRSHCAHWPAGLQLVPLPVTGCGGDAGQRAFRLTVVYATSLHAVWSVALQELVVRLAGADGCTPFITLSMRSASVATPLAHGGRGTASPTSVQYDHPHIVLGTSSHQLVVCRVRHATTHVAVWDTAAPLPPASAGRAASATPHAAEQLRLELGPLLYGHTSGIASVAVDGARCVSGSSDGHVIVWNLRSRAGASSASSPSPVATLRGHVPRAGDDGALLTMRAAPFVPPTAVPRAPLSVAQAVEAVKQAHIRAPAAVRWVAAAFDMILCVAARRGADVEQVQIWSFDGRQGAAG
ncbi:hypothetical protein MSPP1_000302 [Malassezia sp. CBS 17886]|nr:hypothetical protein MSPP1_000302 [Malassezia sp. CBS 17886]